MNFFQKLFKVEKTPMDIEKERRQQTQDLLDNNLKKFGFTKLEIKEVMDIIEIAEANIKIIKEEMASLPTEKQSSEEVLSKARKESLTIQEKMAEDITKKIHEIKKRKDAYKKEL